jgi:ferredoxin-NADP reductase
MAKLISQLISRQAVAAGTMAFFLKRPVDFVFKAGQFIDLTLIDPPETDAEGNTRAFSLASAPDDTNLMVATRLRDTAFKRIFQTMPIGSDLQITNPIGSFTLHNDATKSAVFLIGGVGITPIRSILLEAASQKLPHHLYLFFSNRRPEDAPFLEELQELTKTNPNFQLIATMTEAAGWTGETGYIDAAMVKKYITDLSGAIWYLAGPLAMVTAMRAVLKELEIDEDNIRSEEFSGY